MGISLHERLDRAVAVRIQAFRLAGMRAIESTLHRKCLARGKLPGRIGLDKLVARRGIVDRVNLGQIPPGATTNHRPLISLGKTPRFASVIQ